MPLQRAHVGWGFALSLALHTSALAALSAVLPRLNVRPGRPKFVELAVIREPPPAARPEPSADAPASSAGGPSAPSQPASPDEPTARPRAASESPKRAPARARSPRWAARASAAWAQASPPGAAIHSQNHPDPRSDGSALERVLRQIAATSELSQDERRRAMLVVLRTWQDPSGRADAEALIDALLRELRPKKPGTTPVWR